MGCVVPKCFFNENAKNKSAGLLFCHAIRQTYFRWVGLICYFLMNFRVLLLPFLSVVWMKYMPRGSSAISNVVFTDVAVLVATLRPVTSVMVMLSASPSTVTLL